MFSGLSVYAAPFNCNLRGVSIVFHATSGSDLHADGNTDIWFLVKRLSQ